MDLTIGPNLFFWEASQVRDFYAKIADESPAARVVVGEVVCSKRLPFWQGEIPVAVDRLKAAGKEVWISSLALVTLKRERQLTEELIDAGAGIEIADLTALAYIPAGVPFSVSPLINVYNIGTLDWLASRGAARICLPNELPMESIAKLARAGKERGVAVEVWGFGRQPLAISGRCYHARLHDRIKDSCQFICNADPDGREVDTLDGEQFLAVNGVQTLSCATSFAGREIPALLKADVASLRLSPHTGDMVALTRAFDAALKAGACTDELEAAARAVAPGGQLANGYLHARAGAEWVDA
ncbi:collagenase-like PrtC family protease [Cereibacter ovatus]|uniref:Ubiquinone biosynthesis protein UbiV n=1 Tax=Cereibacter ovatus TaxID=439529 RepID=A0A285D3I1_9RHOB|nr:U32 family peptidase [Cereibacter ovatus]SNX73848.1 collagenase-like PrtC family protease [Cereibacter ovatus]